MALWKETGFDEFEPASVEDIETYLSDERIKPTEVYDEWELLDSLDDEVIAEEINQHPEVYADHIPPRTVKALLSANLHTFTTEELLALEEDINWVLAHRKDK